MCFTVGAGIPTLLVTEADNDRVQEVDVLAPAHVGFPIYVPGPRGVAASASLLAVSSGKHFRNDDHCVHVFDASTRALLYVIGHGCGPDDGQLWCPCGLRLSADGTVIMVADWHNHRVSAFCTSDGAFVGHLANAIEAPHDVEECEGCWLMACGHPSFGVKFVGSGGYGYANGKLVYPSAVVLVPSVGLVVRDDYRVQVFSTADSRRMHGMSSACVTWLGCVVRAGQRAPCRLL